MSWLLRDGDVLATVEERRRGWQGTLQGALVLRRPVLVQTLIASNAGALDVATCAAVDGERGEAAFQVRRISVVPRRRLAPPYFGAGALVVAPVGTFERWRLRVGDRIEVRGLD